jgi:NAD(P)-dependent dehydrogenase (short-subunit alcohol dehydrogenase family)
VSRWGSANVPDQTGRVAVITGANSGIGFQTAAVLADKGAEVVLAVRDLDKGQAAASQIAALIPHATLVAVQHLDLTSLASVRNAATALTVAYPRIDLLVNNAGVMLTPKGSTQDGFELQFGTNHLGHFALTGLLLDQLLSVEGSRIVSVGSLGHRIRSAIDFDDIHFQRGYDPMAAYGRSKLANLLFTYELQRRLATCGGPTIAVAAHPGSTRTELFRNSPRWIRGAFDIAGAVVSNPPEIGALPILRAATDPDVAGGEYYGPGGFFELRGYPTLVQSSARAHDEELQRRLWKLSEELTGVSYAI